MDKLEKIINNYYENHNEDTRLVQDNAHKMNL